MSRRAYRLFGIPVWSVTWDEESTDERGSTTTEVREFGFVQSDLPNWHRAEEEA